MAFKRKESAVQAVDLNTLTPAEVERKIIDAVRKYATRQDNWEKADKNTSFLGKVTGMGIESSNQVDIVMNIERLFLTRMTRRVPIGDGPEFRLEEGELGKLVILDGQDIFSATPGLAVKMLMDHGHMPRDEKYLADVVSFAYVVIIGATWRLNDTLLRNLAKAEKLAEPVERRDAIANLKTLLDQAAEALASLKDPRELERSRREAYAKEKAEFDSVQAEAAQVGEKIKELSSSTDTAALDQLRSKQAELRLRLDSKKLMLRVSEKVAADCGTRASVEEAKIRDASAGLSATAQKIQSLLPSLEAAPCREASRETTSSISESRSYGNGSSGPAVEPEPTPTGSAAI